MKAYTTYLLLAIILVTGLPALAQDGDFQDEYGNDYRSTIKPRDYSSRGFFSDDDNPGSGEEGGGSVEDPEAPIDGIIIWLVISGIGLGWYFYRNKRQTE